MIKCRYCILCSGMSGNSCLHVCLAQPMECRFPLIAWLKRRLCRCIMEQPEKLSCHGHSCRISQSALLNPCWRCRHRLASHQSRRASRKSQGLCIVSFCRRCSHMGTPIHMIDLLSRVVCVSARELQQSDIFNLRAAVLL